MGFKNTIRGAARAVGAAHKPGDTPGQTVGRAVRTAVTAAHPIAGSLAGKAIESVTAKAVDKGVAFAKDPKVQAKAKEIGTNVVKNVSSRVGHMMTGFKNARSHSPEPGPQNGIR